MKEYHIMFRNGDGVTIEGIAHKDDGKFLTVWSGDNRMCAAFSWDAICGFIIEEVNDEKSLKRTD